MLTVTRDARGFLEVKEDTMGWTKTITSYWYYDTENWLCNLFGQKNEEPTRPMAQGQIDWVKTYYLPQLEKKDANPCT